jgi:hypothetical protein
MVGGGWIKVSTCGFEVWGIAFGALMKMKGMVTRSEVLQGEMNFNTLFRLLDGCRPNHGSLDIVEDNSLGGNFVVNSRYRTH